MTYTQAVETGLLSVNHEPQGKVEAKQLAYALVVEVVAPCSIAAKAGVQVGDMLVQTNELNKPSIQEVRRVGLFDKHCHYRFYRPSTGELLEFNTNGMPLGVRLRMGKQAIIELARRYLISYEEIISVWYTKDWALMAAIADILLDAKKGHSFGAWCKRKFHAKEYTTLCALGLVARGIMLFEQGQVEAAQAPLQGFYENHVLEHPVAMRALVEYYLQRCQPDYDHQREAELYAHVLYQLQWGDKEEQAYWQRQDMTDYTLPVLDGIDLTEDQGSLQEACMAMQPGQLLLICLMPGRRLANVYMEHLEGFLTHLMHVSDTLAGMHVITDSLEFASPKALLKQEVNYAQHWGGFSVLYDEDGQVMDYVEPNVFPYGLFVDHQGKIVHVGMPLDDVAWSQLLAYRAANPASEQPLDLEGVEPPITEPGGEVWQEPGRGLFWLTALATLLLLVVLLWQAGDMIGSFGEGDKAAQSRKSSAYTKGAPALPALGEPAPAERIEAPARQQPAPRQVEVPERAVPITEVVPSEPEMLTAPDQPVVSPLNVVINYREAMASGIATPDMDFYTPRTQRMMQQWNLAPAQMGQLVAVYEQCPPPQVRTEGKRAVVRYAVDQRQCAPFFLIREAGGWKLDLAYLSTTIRFNREKAWRFANGVPEGYGFAFADWQFDRYGFPHSKP